MNAITEDSNGFIYVGGVKGSGLVRFDGYEFKYYETNPSDSSSLSHEGIRYLYTDKAGIIWISTFRGLNRFDPQTGIFEVIFEDPNILHADLSNLTEPIIELGEDLWVGSNHGLGKYNRQTKKFQRYYIDSTLVSGPNFIINILADVHDENRLWIATNLGFYYFEISEEEFYKVEGFEKSVFGLHQDTAGIVYLVEGMRGGVSIFNPFTNQTKFISLEPSEELKLTQSNGGFDVSEYKGSKLLVSSNWGIAIFDTKDESFSYIKTDNDFSNNLPLASRVRTFFYDNAGYLWLAAYRGLSRSVDPIQKKKKNEEKKVCITQVILNEQDRLEGPIAALDAVQLDARVESIFLKIVLPNPADPQRTEYSYRIRGDKGWTLLDKNEVKLRNLKGGEFLVEFRARERGLEWQGENEVLFSIEKEFWEHTWVKILTGLLIGLLIIAVYFLRTHQIRKEERIKSAYQKKLSEVEMSALRAQMNPHFLFNTMNSINHYILKNDSESASEYLTKFSRLVRQILNNSKSKTVSLADELSALALYVEMEQLRFENKFKYAVHIDSSIDTEHVKIPPMLMQPYIENAIWHGLMHKEGHGRIDVKIEKENDQLKIFIQDDGIGRENSKAYASDYGSGKKSFGMEITKDRINLINDMYDIQAKLEINDLMKNEEASGTEVVLSIPILRG